MRAHSTLTRLASSLVVGAMALLTSPAFAQSADAILQKARDAYAQMQSYSDTGVAVYEYGASSQDRHTFSTAFIRKPRHFLLQFHKQGGDEYVIWSDAEAFHTWWKLTGQLIDYRNPNNVPAIKLSAQNTAQAGVKVPTLLYATAFGSAMLDIADAVLDGTEEVGVHRCHRITGRMSDVYAATGRESNVRKVTVWIDSDSFLVRRMTEESKATPGQRNRLITTYEPRANPTLDDATFKFTPPAS